MSLRDAIEAGAGAGIRPAAGRRLLFAVISTLFAFPALCVQEGEASAVRAELEQVCEALRQGDNDYFSTKLAAEVRRRLEESPQPAEEAALLGVLGLEMLELGDAEEAIHLLTRGLELARGRELDADLRSSLHWQLALAYLQQGENQNCIDHRSARSCILPITADGVHAQPRAARMAGDLFLSYLHEHPRNVQAAWLLNLSRQISGDYPAGVPQAMRLPEGAFAAAHGLQPWLDRAPELGVAALDLAGGAVMDDFDGDGLLDLVSTTWDPCDSMKAFRNDGRGGFEDVTREWGLDSQLGGLNAVQADYDGDGHLDLLVLRGAWMLGEGEIRNSLLRNQGAAAGPLFKDVTREAGLAEPAYATGTGAWADFDGDGDLDVYIGNEATGGHPYPSQLFRNNGRGADGRVTFTDIAVAAGVTNLRYSKATAWGDYDDDGDPDLYVSNFGPNRLYRNDGEGGFTDVAVELGVTEPAVESFPSWFFDYDNDGDLDLFVADYRQKTAQVSASYFGVEAETGQPLLYRNDGGTFSEVSRQLGLTRPAMPMGANYGDLDNDGWLDFYLGTGEPDLASVMPNQMFHNVGGAFEEVTFDGGFGHLQKGHGVAFGDLDNDGDQDLFHQLGGFYPGDDFGNSLFENPGPARSWVTLRLVGRRANRFAVGARIEVRLVDAGEPRSIHVVVGSGGSFGASSLQQEIGLAAAARIDSLVIDWPRPGGRQIFSDLEINHIYRLTEDEARAEIIDQRPFRLGGVAGGA